MKTYSPTYFKFVLKRLLHRKANACTNLLKLLFLVLLLGFSEKGFSTSASATWALTSNATVSTSGNVTATSATKGSSIGTASYGGTGMHATGWTTAASKDANGYFQYTISPTTGNDLTVSSLSFTANYSSSGTYIIVDVYYSLDNFTTSTQLISDDYVYENTATSISNSPSISVPNGNTLTVRVYGYFADKTTYNFYNLNMVISGTTTVSCSAPSTQASSFSTNTITSSSMNYAFTRGNGTGGVMVICEAGSPPTDPSCGTTYTANSTYGSGIAVGGGYCVYNGTAAGTSSATGNIAITGLTQGTTYYFAVYEYNSSGTCYNLTELSGSATTSGTVYNSYNSTLYTTIQAAVDALPASWAANYTIEVRSSNTYNEAVSISGYTTNSHTLTIQAQSGQTPIVNAGSSGPCFTIDNSYVTIQYFSITGTTLDNGILIGDATVSNNITINQCKIYSNGGCGIEEYEYGGNNLIIENCLIYSNGGDAIQVYNMTAETGLQIINNTMCNNNTGALNWGGIVLIPYSTSYSIKGTIIKNNIIQVNGYSSADACLVFGYTGKGTCPTDVTFTQCDYNDLYNASGGGNSSYIGYKNYSTNAYSNISAWRLGVSLDANSISATPYFVSVGSDFHEQSTYNSYHGGEWPPTTATSGTWTADVNNSTCIDAGLASDAYTNEPVCNGGRINMGCYGNTVQASLSNPSGCATITTSAIAGSPFCAGAAVSVAYTKSGTFSGNTFTAQLSDGSGGWTSPTTLGTLVSNSAGTISGTIPSGTATGTGYRIRVIGSNPATTGSINGSDLVINAIPTLTSTDAVAPVCYSASPQTTTMPYTASANSPASYAIAWTGIASQGTTSYSFVGGGGTMPSVAVPAATAIGTYAGTITITNAGSCTNTYSVSLTVSSTSISAPTISSATSIIATSFTANWGSIAAATGYYLDVSTNSAFSSFVSGYNALSVASTSQSVTGLSPNTTYYYRVRAYNNCATSANSGLITTVTLSTPLTTLGFNIAGNFVNNGTLDQSNDANYLIMSGTSKSITGSGIYTQTKLRSSGTVTFNGTISSGSFSKTFVDASQTFTIASSKTYINGTFTNDGTTTLSSSSAWQNSGNWLNNATVTADATSTVTFNGSSAQTVQSNSSVFGNVAISNSVSPDATHGVILADAMSLKASSVLTLTDGTIITGGNLLTINNTASTAVTSADYTQSWVYATSLSGAIRRYLVNADNGDYVFPVGKASTCNRAVLTNNITTATLYIDCFFNTSYSSSNLNTGLPGNLTEGKTTYNGVLNDGVWELTPSTTISGNYNLKLYFNGFSPMPTDFQFGILSRPTGTTATSWSLTNLGSVSVLAAAGNYAMRSGITTFSEKGIGTTSGVLPVELLSFIASCDDERIKLHWSTASEINNDYFKVEKSRDNNIWDYVTTVSGAGNSNTITEYSIFDEVPYTETIQGTEQSYYRLKQVDFNGNFKYYGPTATICKEQYTFNAYVNTNREINVNFDASNNQNYKINLFDYNGKKLIDQNGIAVDGLNNVLLNTVNLSAGMYILVFKKGNEYETKKLVLN